MGTFKGALGKNEYISKESIVGQAVGLYLHEAAATVTPADAG